MDVNPARHNLSSPAQPGAARAQRAAVVAARPGVPSPPSPGDGSTSSPADQHDDLRAAVDVVGDRWVLLLVAALAGGPRRFGDLAREVRGVAPNVLTDRLRRAERAGLLVATAYQHRPRRVVYDLTAAGREVATILPAFSAWSARRRGAIPPRHPECGTPLELRWWCPECELAVQSSDVIAAALGDDAVNADLVWV